MRNKRGFTLAELLIVIAIIAVLVAISIPIFTNQLEKARRAVDMQNARVVQTALATAFSVGEVEVPTINDDHGSGIWVTICRNSSSLPNSYIAGQMHNGTLFCGTNKGVVVNGNKWGAGSSGNPWNQYNKDVEKILTDAGIDLDSLKIRSNGGKDGWDWIVIEVGYIKTEFFSRMYSGYKNTQASMGQNKITNLEKQIGG